MIVVQLALSAMAAPSDPTEVIVWGEEEPEEAHKTEVSAEELRRVPGAFGDPVRALQSLPSVARPSSLEGDLVVRGAEGINTGTYIDEIPVPYLFHFFVGRSVVNPVLLDEVEFYPGGMPSRFGDVTQAVVNARMSGGGQERGLHGRASIDLMDGSIGTEARLSDRLSIAGAFRVSWLGALVGLGTGVYAGISGAGGRYRPEWPEVVYRDHLLRGAWDDGRDRIALTWLGASDRLILHPERLGGTEPIHVEPWDPSRLLDSGFERWQLRWDRTTERSEHTTWVAFGPEHEQSLLEGLGQLTDAVDLARVEGFTWDVTHRDRWELGRSTVLALGADGWANPARVLDYRGWNEVTGLTPVTKDLRASGGGWLELQQRIGATWISPGIRAAGHTFLEEEYSSLEPRLTLRQGLGDWLTAVGFLGRFSQVPPIERYAAGIGDPDLTLLRSDQASLGLEARWSTGWEVDLTGYASRTGGLVVKDTRVVLDPLQSGTSTGTAFPALASEYSATTGVAYGVESLVRLRPGGPTWGWVAASVGRSLRQQPDGTWVPGDYDLPIALTIVAVQRLPRTWHVSGRLRLTSGYPFTPLQGSFDPVRDVWMGIPLEPNSDRFPLYRQLDVRVDKTWNGRRADWTLFLDILNVTNARNPLLAQYDGNFTELEPTAWIPIVPNLGLEVDY